MAIMESVTPKLILTVLVCAMGSSFQFYHCGVVNTPQNIMENWINQTYANRGTILSDSSLTVLWSVIVSVVPLGACIGCLFTRWLVDHVGRRNSLVWNGALNVIGCTLAGISKPTNLPELLIISRLLLGLNLGSASGIVPIYVTEIAPVKYRGAFGTTHMIFVALGDVLALAAGLPQVFGTDTLWPLAMALPGVPALIMTIVLPFCPESPRFLYLVKKEYGKAKQALDVFIGQPNSTATFRDLERECRLMEILASRKAGHQRSVRNIIRQRELRTPLLISILVMVAQQFTGVVSIFSYSTTLFQNSGLSLNDARFSTVGIGAAYFVFTLSSIYMIEKLGRRPLSLFQLTGCLCSLIIFFIANMSRTYVPGSESWTSPLSIVSLVLFMCIYGAGSPIPWMISSELFTLVNRSTAVSVSTFVAWFWSFIINVSFLPFQQAVGQRFVYLPFILVLSVSVVLMALFLPETRNRSIEDIVSEFRQRRNTVSQIFTETIPNKVSTARVPFRGTISERFPKDKFDTNSSTFSGTETESLLSNGDIVKTTDDKNDGENGPLKTRHRNYGTENNNDDSILKNNGFHGAPPENGGGRMSNSFSYKSLESIDDDDGDEDDKKDKSKK